MRDPLDSHHDDQLRENLAFMVANGAPLDEACRRAGITLADHARMVAAEERRTHARNR